MSRAGFLQTWCLELKFIRPEKLVSQSLRVLLGALLHIPSVFSCVLPEERIESCHTAIKPRSVECCSDVCPSVDFSHLHIWSWSSTRVTIRFLVTTFNRSPSPSVAQFEQMSSSRKSPGCFKLLLRVTETTCFCDPSVKQSFFSELFPRCVALRKPVSELYRQFFWPQGLVFALICIISC